MRDFRPASRLALALCRAARRIDPQAVLVTATLIQFEALWEGLTEAQRAQALEHMARDAAELGWRLERADG